MARRDGHELLREYFDKEQLVVFLRRPDGTTDLLLPAQLIFSPQFGETQVYVDVTIESHAEQTDDQRNAAQSA